MANVYASPVLFTKEKNVHIFTLRAVFDNNGVVALDTSNSKGICAFGPDQVSFSGNTVASSASVSSVTSFAGLFNGMTVTGITQTVGAAVTISSMTAGTSTLVLSSGTNVVAQPANALIATGGRYRVQFGTLSGINLTPFVKLMGFSYDFRETTASASGNATRLQLYPYVEEAFVVQNNIAVRTIPATTTSGSTDASIAVQFGYYGSDNNTFTATTPKAGEVVHMTFVLGNSTAP